MIAFNTKGRDRGFSLLEVILVLVIAAVLGVMLYQFFGAAFTQSTAPVLRLQKTHELRRAMEAMTAAYESSDKSLAALNTLQAEIDNGTYAAAGGQVVVENAFVVIDPTVANEPAVLKVTIADNESGEGLTVLFTSQ